MQIHLSDITDSEGKHIQLQLGLDLDKISFQMGDYPILEKTPIELDITNTGNKVLEMKGTGAVVVGIPCDRCLEQVAVKIPYEAAETLTTVATSDVTTSIIDSKRLSAFLNIFFSSLCDNASISLSLIHISIKTTTIAIIIINVVFEPEPFAELSTTFVTLNVKLSLPVSPTPIHSLSFLTILNW